MKYYFKINGKINEKTFMNLLFDKLFELKDNKGNDNRTIFIKASETSFEIDINLQSDNDELIEEFEKDGIEEKEYEDFLELLDLKIGVKLFKKPKWAFN